MQLGGIDRVIVNAGIGKERRLGSGKLWANKTTIETNLVAALVQIETALEMFTKSGSGHLVLISSVLGQYRGCPASKRLMRPARPVCARWVNLCAPNMPKARSRSR